MIFCFGPWKCEYYKDKTSCFHQTLFVKYFTAQFLNMTFTFKFDRHAERPNIQLTAARDWIEFKSRVLSYSADADCRPVLTLEQELNADNAEDWANCDNKMVSFIKNRISSNIHMNLKQRK